MEEEIKDEVSQEEAKEPEKEDQTEEQTEDLKKPLDKMTAKELREVAMGIEGITGAHAMKKEELLVLIKEAKGIKDEEPDKRKKKVIKADVNLRELKEKIARLKEEKTAARMGEDKKKVDILRRRISRLKKLTRKVAHA